MSDPKSNVVLKPLEDPKAATQTAFNTGLKESQVSNPDQCIMPLENTMTPSERAMHEIEKQVKKTGAWFWLSVVDPSTLEIEAFWASTPGQGQGSAALEVLAQVADSEGVTVKLMVHWLADPDEPPSMWNDALERMYKKFGFLRDAQFVTANIADGETRMTRSPKLSHDLLNSPHSEPTDRLQAALHAHDYVASLTIQKAAPHV